MSDDVHQAEIRFREVKVLEGEGQLWVAIGDFEGVTHYGIGVSPPEAVKALFAVAFPGMKMRAKGQAAWSPLAREILGDDKPATN